MQDMTLEQAQAQGLTTSPELARLAYMQAKYGMTPKQAAYAVATLTEPHKSAEERAEIAGYGDSARSDGGRVLKSATITRAVIAEREEIERRMADFGKALGSDARGAIQNKLVEHTERADVTPNQTRAVELLGKMHGVFIDRIELDAGPHTRSRFADEILGNNSQPSEEKE